MPSLWCVGVAGGSWEAGWGSAALVFFIDSYFIGDFWLSWSQDIAGREGRSSSSLLPLLRCAGCFVSRSPGRRWMERAEGRGEKLSGNGV